MNLVPGLNVCNLRLFGSYGCIIVRNVYQPLLAHVRVVRGSKSTREQLKAPYW
jgi:hypothetical protein